jgi:hypothetical protein
MARANARWCEAPAHHCPFIFASQPRRADFVLATRVLAHDEVGEGTAMSFGIADEFQRHPVVRFFLNANDLGGEMKRFFAREIEVDLGGLAEVNVARGAHEQATARDIFDEPVDDEPLRATLHAHPDTDSNCCPLVHVVKRRLLTYVHEINSATFQEHSFVFQQLQIHLG